MKNNMQLEVKDEALVISFEGDLDNMSTFQYKEKLVSIISSNRYQTVIMNFSDVVFIDSSGIGLILGRYNQIKDYGGVLKLTGIGQNTNKLFSITGLYTIMKKYNSIDEAIKEEVSI